MPQTTSARLEILEQNLRAIALIRDTLSASELDAQISQLLQEVLNEEEIVDPLVDSLDLGDEDQRIVITGIGLVTPYGVGIDPFWQGVSGGHSAIRPITHFDASAYPCRIAGEVPHFEAIDFLESREVRRLSRSSQFAVAAARMSVSHARLRIDHGNRDEIGTIIGCGTTSMPDFEQAMQTMLTRGPQRVSPFFIPAALPNMPASQVAIQLGLRGHTTAISTACAAGAQAIGEAAAVIQRGDAEIMLAGGSEAPIAAISLASFCAMRALSTRNDDPARASRPFDALRDGFVSGEGAGVLVLERLSSARRRGAPILAELLGYGCSCDAYHVTAPDPDGIGAARAMRKALQNARIGPQQVDYINAHATGTPVGDIAETRAIKHVFGEYAFNVPISSIKSMIGHLTGAAGAVEAAATVLALKHGTLPPTINQESRDPDCDLDYVPNQARSAAARIAISNSFGFGGVNAVLVLRKM